jgi:hypothetical protein
METELMEFEIQNVAEFVTSVLSRAFDKSPRPVYRGLSDRKHLLLPSIGRHTTNSFGHLLPKEELASRELEVLSKFRGASVPFITTRDGGMLDVMTRAQHHGAPTRLLDWTNNPLIALYFATTNTSKTTDGVVYEYDAPKPIHLVPGAIERPISAQENCSFEPQHIDMRITAQDSVFTLHADPYKPLDKGKMVQIWFKGDCRQRLKAELEKLGVHAASVFPGQSGVGEHIRAQIFGTT